jgi:nucleotidyltransferase/DNA polymerase involved in DNA repair
MDPDRITAYDLEQDVHRITLYSSVAREHQHVSLKPRLYLHIDMNCFYAQVEQRAYNLYGLPVAMGGWRKPDGTPRGIVATASYEARQLGIKTAMSAFEAHQICPYLIFLQIDYDKYKGISRQLQAILEDFAPDVEKYSMDEYFLDVTFLQRTDACGHHRLRHPAQAGDLRRARAGLFGGRGPEQDLLQARLRAAQAQRPACCCWMRTRPAAPSTTCRSTRYGASAGGATGACSATAS